jgi:hypothetical protein
MFKYQLKLPTSSSKFVITFILFKKKKKHTCDKIHGNEIVLFNGVYMRIFSVYAAVYSLA